MATNKFATMLHRNTNKITLILVYAVLEWILILLLLLNSLFSHLIIKFAEYFGLKKPCPWCTNLDHIFDPAKRNKNMHIDSICEVHSKEISKLGYCLNHQKLAESEDMCENCSPARPEFQGNFTLFSGIKEFGMVQSEEKKVSLNCSCCGVSLNDKDNNIYSSYILVKTSSWDVLECAQKEKLMLNAGDYDDHHHIHIDESVDSDEKVSDFDTVLCDGKKVLEFDRTLEVKENETKELEGKEDEKVEENEAFLLENSDVIITRDKSVQVCIEEDAMSEISLHHLEFFLDSSGHKLVPIELVDSITEDNLSVKNKDQESSFNGEFQVEKEEIVKENSDILLEVDEVIKISEESKFKGFDEISEDKSSLFLNVESSENFIVFPASASDFEGMTAEGGDRHSDVLAASEEVAQMSNIENEADVSIGTEIPDLDVTDENQNEVSFHSYEEMLEDPLTCSANIFQEYDQGPSQVDGSNVELKPLSFQETDHTMTDQLSFHLELNEIQEDKIPDTPTSLENFNHLHKNLHFFEKRDCESLDGSVTSELDGGDGVVTIERLKSALRSERKTMQALYAELEEERSASAIAANQTMAMINRLQEEKAAMQMEALQYQRMMEEQSEYDQEALQLLNELMVKREKEKIEVEKELEVYRKRLLDYEARERTRVFRKSKDGSFRNGFSSGSCSNPEDSDGVSIDLNQEAKEEEGYYGNYTPVDEVVNLEESLADFEEERFSILEQLKVLEEKIMTLDDFEQENGNNGNGHFSEANGHHENGHSSDTNGKHYNQHRRAAVQNGKSLLPLFDAINDDNGIESNEVRTSYESKFDVENKNLVIKEEFNNLYQRLQAFEADREFLKHCFSSLKKGDKGMDLLQEILQHLRDLRNVELRFRTLSDNAIV